MHVPCEEPKFGPLPWGLQAGKYSLIKGGVVQTRGTNEKCSVPLSTVSAKGQRVTTEQGRTFGCAYSQVQGTADCW